MRVVSKGQLAEIGERALMGPLVELHPCISTSPLTLIVRLIASSNPTQQAAESSAFKQELTIRPTCWKKQSHFHFSINTKNCFNVIKYKLKSKRFLPT